MEELDTLVNEANQVLSQTSEGLSHWELNHWFVIAMVELLLIIVLLFLRVRSKGCVDSKKAEFKKKALDENVDFDNIMNSAFHAKEVYDELKGKCHPDKFATDPEKNAIALDIFQQITENKNNISKLKELKQRAIDELGISF